MIQSEGGASAGKPLWEMRYWHREEPPAGASVWVFKVVHFRSDGHFHSLQMPSGITLRLIVAGEGRVAVNGEEEAAGAGDFFCAIPGVLIRFQDAPQSPWEWLEWQLTGSEAMAYLQGLGVGRRQAVARAARPGEAAGALHRLLDCFAAPDRQPYQALALLYEIAHHCAPPFAAEQALKPREDLVSRAQALLEARLEAGININELAARLGANRTTLLRAFQHCLGQTPAEYLQERRLSRAKELLRGTGLPVREVARHTGFRTDKYFIRVFREACGQTPAVWRRG